MSDFLCAYFISKETIDENSIIDFLSKKLPSYMIPNKFIQIEKMPLTSNGKVNRKELLNINKVERKGKFLKKAEGKIQLSLELIYKEILSIENIGINESFFDLGGDSLQVIKLISKIFEIFDMEFNYNEVYMHSTIQGLSKLISEKLLKGYTSNDIEKTVTLLNDKKEINIFAFPPIAGFGLVYSEMAQNLSDFSLYAFNYIEDKDKINKYINIIKEIQKEGKYILLGFSAGSNLVFEISQRMKDEELTIIFMDGFFYEDIDRKDIDRKVNEYIVNVLKLDENNKFLKQLLKSKIENFMEYIQNNDTYTKKINKDIYILQSNEMSDKRVDLLKNLTTGEIIRYRVDVNHLDLIAKNYVKRNAEIIKSIIGNKKIRR